MKKMKHILFLSLALMLVAGCSSTKEEVLNPSAEVLYNQAFDLLQKTSYKKAAETFEKIDENALAARRTLEAIRQYNL